MKSDTSISQPVEASEGTAACRYIDWYAEGQERVVEVEGVRIVISYVGRKGRRGRIKIVAPPGATFRSTA